MKRWIVCLFVVLFSSVITVSAQSSGSTSGSIIGSVKDQQFAALAGARIEVRNVDTNLTRATQSDEDGLYYLPQLPPGNYVINVQLEGFVPETSKVTLNIGTTLLADFILNIGNTTDVIEITAGTETIGKTESSRVVDRRSIANLPINRRNFLDFAATAPRVLMDRSPITGVNAASGLSFNGQPGRFNNITIDGLDNNDPGSGAVRSTFGQDAVREFQVVSDSYSAEFGRALGGIVNIVTRSGNNQFNGNIFLFNRDNRASARDVFAFGDPEFNQKQFGVVAGGPIQRDRSFFFTSFERFISRQNNFVNISDDALAAIQRQGFASVKNGNVPFSIGTTSVLARFDTRLSANNNLWIRYNGGFTYNGAFEKVQGGRSETNGGIQRLNDNSFAASNTYINAGLNLVNETRFLFGRRDQVVSAFDDGPGIMIEGIAQFGQLTFLPQPRLELTYQVVNNLSLTRGRHQIKFGGDFQYFRSPKGDSRLPFAAGGAAVFTPLNFSELFQIPNLPTLTALQAFDPSLRTPAQRQFLQFASTLLPTVIPGFPQLPLADLGLPLFYGQGFGDDSVPFDSKLFAAYVQDDFRVNPNLLVKAGVRYDLNRIRYTNKNSGNFAPRLSLSWAPLPARLPNLRYRAAYGLFFGTIPIGPIFQSQLYESEQYNLLVLAPPFSVIPYARPGRNFPPSNVIPGSVPNVRQFSIEFQTDDNIRNSYTQQVSTGFEYKLGRTLLSLNYNYVRGIKLFGKREVNPVIRPIPGDPLNGFIMGRPDTTRGSVQEFSTAFDSYYHGFTIAVDHKIADRLDLNVNYTVSKAIDNFTSGFSDDIFDDLDNPLRIDLERSLSLQDVRHRAVISGVYAFDIGRNRLLRGWQLSTIANITSGRPLNLQASGDLNMNDSNGDRPRVNGVTIGRNAAVSQAFASVDLRVQRNINFNERINLQLFAEFFNLLNRVNLDPDRAFRAFAADSNGNFDLPPIKNGRYILPRERYNGAFPARQVQFGFRMAF